MFSTLHTNSAPESIPWLPDMGMDPFNFADALLGILAKRLAKKLCDCKESCVPGAQEMKDFLKNTLKSCATQMRGSWMGRGTTKPAQQVD